MAEKLAILGRKLGMTRIFDLDGTVLPVTLVQAGPCPVVQVKTQERDGYHALQIGYGDAKAKHLTRAQRGHLAKAGERLCRTLREIRLQAPSEFEVGQDIIVVGNPGGLDYQNTTTKGVISALDRKLSTSSLTKYIQTDAAINPGNSGGPLVNYYGQVVGITTSKIVSETYEGMGFAIPSQTVKSIVDTLVKNGYVEGRVKIGISGIAVTSDQASNYNIPQGIYVQSIVSGGPCDGTSLEEGDIITEVDGETITSFADVYAILETHKPGDKIKVKYYSSSSGDGEVEITLQEDK